MTPICNDNEGDKHKSSQMIYSILLYNLSSNFSIMLVFFLSFECLKALIIFKNEAIKKPNLQLKHNIS